MNTITTGCAPCLYYWNGECTNSDMCMGIVVQRAITYTNTKPGDEIFVTGTKVVNDYNYCPYCGKKLR